MVRVEDPLLWNGERCFCMPKLFECFWWEKRKTTQRRGIYVNRFLILTLIKHNRKNQLEFFFLILISYFEMKGRALGT